MLSAILRHLHLRKRIRNNLEPYPHNRLPIKILDDLILLIATVGPLANLPQIIEIYSRHSAKDVSSLSWIIYTIFDIPWIIYGIVHKERPIVIAYILWFLTNLIVVIGTFIY